ncbi:MAG: hypothetical protein ACN4G0_00335 [Polyangiales bacterium]
MRGFGIRLALTVLAAPCFCSSALAQSEAVVVSGSELGVMTQPQIEARIAELQKEHDAVRLAGPRAGLGVSAVLIPVGALALGLGAGVRSLEVGLLCPQTDPKCGDPSAGSTTAVILGAFALVGGIVGIAISSRRVKEAKKEQRRIQLEILGFQNSLRSP